MNRPMARKADTAPVEGPPGILRTTIAYNVDLMLCHFSLRAGAAIPMHRHAAVQNGYLLRGRVKMVWESGKEMVAAPGDGWCFAANVGHRAEILEDSEAIECFAPGRPEYVPLAGDTP